MRSRNSAWPGQERSTVLQQSSQIMEDRANYYEILEETQKGSLDITNWISWFLNSLAHAIEKANAITDSAVRTEAFWRNLKQKVEVNDRQPKMLNKLLAGFDGKLTTEKWARITKSSTKTALRDIQMLIEVGTSSKTQAAAEARPIR